MKKGKFLSLLMAVVMAVSVLPMSLINTAAAGEPVRIYALKFRAHPQTYSIFEETVPNNMLWAEFINETDHEATYHQEPRTYELDGKYYQIEISRPQHGPSESPHPAASIVPEEDVSGHVKDEYADGQARHIYHGWEIGKEEDGKDGLFEADTEREYQVGDYTATLNLLTTEGAPENFAATESLQKTKVNSKDLTIVDITYTLSDEDTSAGYKLKCPMHESPENSINELVAVGDLTAVVDPSLNSEAVEAEPKKVIVGWKVVKNKEQKTLSDPIGNYIPDDGQDGFEDEDTSDHKLTLQAILDEPKSYAYEITDNIDHGENLFPTTEPSTEPAPVSFNNIAKKEKIEYEPEGTIEPITLRLVNKGNQCSYIYVKSDNDVFTVERINKNTGAEAKKPLYQGGLDAFDPVFWYIPPENVVTEHNREHSEEEWFNYADIKITPKKGLSVGKHTGIINVINKSESVLGKQYKVEIEVSKREVQIAPQNVEKPYGKELTDADILCDVYDSTGATKIASNKKASELGVPTSFSKNIIQSDGMRKDAKVGEGTSDGKYVYKALADVNSANYDIKLKPDLDTGITVIKAMPELESVSPRGKTRR